MSGQLGGVEEKAANLIEEKKPEINHKGKNKMYLFWETPNPDIHHSKSKL